MQIKKIISLLLLFHLYFNISAQSKPTEISIGKNVQIISLDDEPKKHLYDSAELVNKISVQFCNYLEVNFQNKVIGYNNFISEGFGFIAKLSEDTLTFLEEKTCPGCNLKSVESLSSAYQLILKKSFNECNTINKILNFDGKQRPAYAYLSTQICKCVDKKIENFKDRELALLKFQYISDSCVNEVFSDQKNRDIAFKANNFETKAQVDSFDMNFRPFVYKNCDIFFEATMGPFKIWLKRLLNTIDATSTMSIYGIDAKRNNTVHYATYHISGLLGSPNSNSLESNFVSNSSYKASLTNINSAKAYFNKISNLDFLQESILRSDNVTEFKLTIYQYLAKAKKRILKGIIIFEFEKQSDRITSFRFIPQNQIPNYEALQKKINEH